MEEYLVLGFAMITTDFRDTMLNQSMPTISSFAVRDFVSLLSRGLMLAALLVGLVVFMSQPSQPSCRRRTGCARHVRQPAHVQANATSPTRHH
ncbi:hypothetical protein K474DRAFT_1662609 [Panus rudis PR-1116 ss-1]|nr:hypothetical protein K474DRAFT_1662609 [Panus rudis PR-1116 ss-1]